MGRIQTAHSPMCWFKAGDAQTVLSRLALIFRVLLNETQSQSQIVTNTPNIPELGISTGIPLTEYRLDVVSTLGTASLVMEKG
jgi:hypothetical protein